MQETASISAESDSARLRNHLDSLLRDASYASAISEELGKVLELSQKSVRELGQLVFETLRGKNYEHLKLMTQAFSALFNSIIRQAQLALQIEKFKDSRISKIEAGLDELAVEIKSNPNAMAIFEQLRKELGHAG